MQPETLRRMVPLLVVGALLLALAAAFGPGMLRAAKLRATIREFIELARAGNLAATADFVEPSERRLYEALIPLAPVDYHVYIRRARLTSYTAEDGYVWAIVTVNYDAGGGGIGVSQFKLKWAWDGAAWKLMPAGSYHAPLSTSGPPQWERLGDLVNIVESGGQI